MLTHLGLQDSKFIFFNWAFTIVRSKLGLTVTATLDIWTLHNAFYVFTGAIIMNCYVRLWLNLLRYKDQAFFVFILFSLRMYARARVFRKKWRISQLWQQNRQNKVWMVENIKRLRIHHSLIYEFRNCITAASTFKNICTMYVDIVKDIAHVNCGLNGLKIAIVVYPTSIALEDDPLWTFESNY